MHEVLIRFVSFIDWKQIVFLFILVRDEGVLTHLRELDEAARDRERYRSITLEDLRTDRDKRNMVLHALLVSIQASIDIANHLVAASSSRRPETYRESFIICPRLKI